MNKTFGELSIDEKLELHRAMYEGRTVKFWADNLWMIKTAHTFLDDYLYRIEPEPETDIELPWHVIQPEYQWAARDADGAVWVYTSEPSVDYSRQWWYGIASRNCGFLIHKPGSKLWDQSLIKRPEGV